MTALAGRSALVTGVTRRTGIGFATARRLGRLGADLFLQGYAPADDLRADDEDVLAELRAQVPGRVELGEYDFLDPWAPENCVAAAREALGHLDILVANHARSSNVALTELTAAEIDATFAVNVRATLLLVRAFALQHDGREGGRVVLLTSGQHRGPMAREIPYAGSKGALHQLTQTLGAELIERGIRLNTVNPGPTETGWASDELRSEVDRLMPLGRWGDPDDAARAIAWLCTDDARWIVGQVIDSEGGFRLRAT